MHLLMTGSSGRLGTELLRITQASARFEGWTVTGVSSRDADIRDRAQVEKLIKRDQPHVILHAAAYTDVARAEREQQLAWAVNVDGTKNVAIAAQNVGARLIHISTDYVFWGGDDRPEGGYREDDPTGPVRNTYALTKLAAEDAALHAPDPLIIRTSFRPSEWPHPKAFTDVFTSQDYVDVIANQVAVVMLHHEELRGVALHLGTRRKSVYDLVAQRNPGVKPGSRHEASVNLPADVSLNVTRFETLFAAWEKQDAVP